MKSLSLSLSLCCLFHISPLCAQDPIEFGSVNLSVADGWVTIDLLEGFTTPIVTTGSISSNDIDAVVTEVRNVTATSFEVRILDWGTSGLHTAAETISFMAVEQGRHIIGGLTFEAGKKTDFTTLTTNANGRTGFQSVYFDPIVKQEGAEGVWNYSGFTQIIGNDDASAINCRLNSSPDWTDKLSFRFEQSTGDSSNVIISELHYIVIQAGEGVTAKDAIPFKVFGTEPLFDDDGAVLEYGDKFENPIIYTRMATIKGYDAANLRVRDVEEEQVTIYVVEATGGDKDHSFEPASMLIIGNPNDHSIRHLDATSVTANSAHLREDMQVDGDVTIGGELLFTDEEGNTVSVGDKLSSLVNSEFESLTVGDFVNLSDHPLFAVGNGTDENNLSSLLVVSPSGQTTLSNSAWLADSSVDTATGRALLVEGHTELKGTVIISEPQGDISMGDFE